MAKFLGVLMAALLTWSLTAADALAGHGRWQQVENKANCAVWIDNPKSNDTVTWNGACANGKAQGLGTQVWRFLKDGKREENTYTGEMKDGKEHGHGVFVMAIGSRYEGEFKDGKRHGRGVAAWPIGDRYEGDWKNGDINGRGVFVYADGGRYEGEFMENKQHGRGVLVAASGNRYEGEFRDGKEHGRGVFVWASGDKCEGDWRERRLFGTGEGLRNGEFAKCYDDGGDITFKNPRRTKWN